MKTPNKEKNYISESGYKKLSDELQQLLKIERPKICELITWAASLGDRSENADYIYGKKRLREIDSRIRFLNKRLDLAVVVDPSKNKGEKVQFGATTKVVDDDGEEKSYQIVGVDETDAKNGKISWKSPIGSALMGKTEGDSVLIRTPKGEFELEILSIEYK